MEIDNLNPFISTTFFPDDSKINDVLELCLMHGIKNIELGCNHIFEPDQANIVKKFYCNYLVHNYFPVPKEGFVVNIASLDDKIYQRSVEHLFKSIEFCDLIKAKLYTFHPGFLTDPRGANFNTFNFDFQFQNRNLDSKNYQNAFERMLNAISQAVNYAHKLRVKIAMETAGSTLNKEHLLMQRPEEYKHLFQYFSNKELGINLNIGHLRLASNAYGFKIKKFVDLIADYLIAMELSHNEGVYDEHRPLIAGEWYWEIILDPRFTHTHKILEFRNTSIENILDNIKLFREYLEQ